MGYGSLIDSLKLQDRRANAFAQLGKLSRSGNTNANTLDHLCIIEILRGMAVKKEKLQRLNSFVKLVWSCS